MIRFTHLEISYIYSKIAVDGFIISWHEFGTMLLFDFINLTQVHNFTVSALDIFTSRQLSVFTISFIGILQVLMQIMKRFVPSY